MAMLYHAGHVEACHSHPEGLQLAFCITGSTAYGVRLHQVCRPALADGPVLTLTHPSHACDGACITCQ